MKCQNCKSCFDTVCDQCGTKIYLCPECHTPGKGEGKRCGMCGSKLAPAEELAGANDTASAQPQKPVVATKLVCRQESIILDLQNGAVLGRLEGPYQAMLSRLEYVSARHAQIWAEGDRWIISDLGSRNGTAVNGQWCYNPLPFHVGDTVRLANFYDFVAE